MGYGWVMDLPSSPDALPPPVEVYNDLYMHDRDKPLKMEKANDTEDRGTKVQTSSILLICEMNVDISFIGKAAHLYKIGQINQTYHLHLLHLGSFKYLFLPFEKLDIFFFTCRSLTV